MGYSENILKDKRGNSSASSAYLLARQLSELYEIIFKHVCETFPTLDPEDLDKMLVLCAKNAGLGFAPTEYPDYILGFFRYWPDIIEAVEQWDFSDLWTRDLSQGPIVHIAVLIAPARGYSITRELIDTLNPMAVSCHRYRGDVREFRFKKNARFSGEKAREDLQ